MKLTSKGADLIKDTFKIQKAVKNASVSFSKVGGEIGDGIADYQKLSYKASNLADNVSDAKIIGASLDGALDDAGEIGKLADDVADLKVGKSLESGRKPIGATYEGTIYRSVDSRYDPLEMSQYTINSNHWYTESGVPGLYFSSGEKIVKAELGNYDVFDFSNRTMYSYDVRLTNMLDVSNPSVRSQLGISLESIVGESYDVTHAIGRYAYSNGYNGIIAPSARADGGINIILFNAKGVK